MVRRGGRHLGLAAWRPKSHRREKVDGSNRKSPAGGSSVALVGGGAHSGMAGRALLAGAQRRRARSRGGGAHGRLGRDEDGGGATGGGWRRIRGRRPSAGPWLWGTLRPAYLGAPPPKFWGGCSRQEAMTRRRAPAQVPRLCNIGVLGGEGRHEGREVGSPFLVGSGPPTRRRAGCRAACWKLGGGTREAGWRRASYGAEGGSRVAARRMRS